MANVYLITPAKNPADQLDIFDARQLIQPHYKKEEFLILGIAAGYEEALQLIEQITGECLTPEATVIFGSIYYVNDSF